MKELSPTLKRMVNSCGLPQALEAMGERWSFMILLAAFNGITNFEEFQSTLGIARNILANRLARLTERGILARTACPQDRRRINYTLTEKGHALFPTLIALRQWGERWESGQAAGAALVDLRDCRPVQEIKVRAADGRELGYQDSGWMSADGSIHTCGNGTTPGEPAKVRAAA